MNKMPKLASLGRQKMDIPPKILEILVPARLPETLSPLAHGDHTLSRRNSHLN
jgi:hypothetical protein